MPQAKNMYGLATCIIAVSFTDGCVHEGAYYNELTIVPINKSDPCEACFCHVR